MKFKIKSDNNRKINLNMAAINTYVGRYKAETEFEVEVVRRKVTVSSPMRRYFFGVVMPIFLEAYGYDPDESLILHERLKIVFFGVPVDNHGVYRKKDIPSIFGDDSDVPIEKKQQYIEWIVRKSSAEGYYTPDPGQT